MADYASYYDANGAKVLMQLRPRREALSTYKTKDNIVIGIFQGQRGGNPLLDIRVKILLPNGTPFQPTHTIWVVDLMLKVKQGFKREVSALIDYYLNFYDNTPPWQTAAERINYEPMTVEEVKKKFVAIDDPHTLSIEYVAIMIELFCRTEKLTPGAYWFRNLLVQIQKFANGQSNYINTLRAAEPGF